MSAGLDAHGSASDRGGPRTRIVFTGASGLLGVNTLATAELAYADRVELIGTYLRHPVQLNFSAPPRAFTLRPLELTDADATSRFLDEAKPAVVIHAAANANIDDCESQRDAARKLNVEVPRALARYCAETDTALIHLSTDAFFDRASHRFTEADPPAPVNAYGEHKRDAERAVLEACPAALVVRTNFFGWNTQANKRSLAEWILFSLVAGKRTPLFPDVFFSPLYAPVLAETLLDLALLITQGPPTARPRGILHVAGADTLSKLDFGQRLCRAFGLDPALIAPTPVQQGGLAARRANQMGLAIDRARALFPTRDFSIDAGIRRLHADAPAPLGRAIKGEGWRLGA